MHRITQLRLLKQLQNSAPSVPSASTAKSRAELITKLFQLAPENPFMRVSGIELLKTLTIPSSPKPGK